MSSGTSRCVGLIIQNDLDEYLALFRLKSPSGLAFVAGHVDEGETPEKAAIREADEEVDIKVIKFREVLRATLPNKCSGGHEKHEWFVYNVTKWLGAPKNREPQKHSFVQFLSKRDLEDWQKIGDVDPVWFDEILPTIGIINK